MVETKIVEVGEESRNRIITDYQCFGWTVLSTQKIDYTTSYTTGGGNARSGYHYTVHNDRTAYYSITFQREKDIEHHEELDRLFSEYEALDARYKQLSAAPAQKFPVAAIVLFVVGPIVSLVFGIIGLILMANPDTLGGGLALGLIGTVVLALSVIFGVRSIIKARNVNAQINAQHFRKRDELVPQMKEIVAKAKEIRE